MTNIGRRAGPVIAIALAMGLAVTGCTDVLVEPKSEVTSGNVFNDVSAYESFLAKVYAGLAVTGQQGPAGAPDIEGIDEGFSQYIRGWWQLQTLPTDEAVLGWGDAGIPELVTTQWASTNQFVAATYYRIYFQIALANEFLRETTQDALATRGHDDLAVIPQYRAEVRVLRALSYWHGLDLYRNIPLVTEDFAAGDPAPSPATPQEMFDFIESELQTVRGALPAAGAADYGRVDDGVVSMILAKLYMNAEAYGVADRYGDAMTEIQNVISGPYTLDDNYHDMFLADNHTSPELIFAVPFDGESIQTWGGTTFLSHASVGGNMDPAAYGLDFGWWGLRVPPEVVNLFEGGAGGADGRSDIFFTDGQSLEITSIGDFFAGYAYPKFQNVTSGGSAGSHPTFPDVDFPMFRLADAYLMYAEAHLRGGGGTAGQALTYVNALRERAYGDNSGNLAVEADLTLDFVLDERARELAWEGHRRTDLIRYGLFTGDTYVWAWKGNTQAGSSTPATRDLYPIPAQELIANPNLTQNEGY